VSRIRGKVSRKTRVHDADSESERHPDQLKDPSDEEAVSEGSRKELEMLIDTNALESLSSYGIMPTMR
jgi:hypothetical protein